MNLFKKPDIPEPNSFMPPKAQEIDTTKCYDIYTQFGQDRLLIYRKVKFVGFRSLPGSNTFSGSADLLVVREDDGTELMISSFSYFCICEHGKKPSFEVGTIDQLKG